jgi:N-acetylglutamate synthase
VPHRRLLDEVAANSVPAPVTHLVDGWLAKSAPDLPFRRANSVLPPMGAGADPARVDAALAALEEWHGERGLRVAVRVSFGDAMADALDEQLSERSYEVEGPMIVKVGATTDVLARCLAEPHQGVTAEVRVAIDDDWIELADEVRRRDEEGTARTAAFARILRPLGIGALLAVGRIEGEPAGIAFGVVERGLLGVVGMHTIEAGRRTGVGTTLVGALVTSAVERGVARTYVEIETGNTAGRSLFVAAGFARSHRHHYRVSSPT